MKKKVFIMLPCIAAVAIATFVGKKTLDSHAFESDGLLVQNVEALADPDVPSSIGYNSTHLKCYDYVYYNNVLNAIENGKNQGICWTSPLSSKACHSHSCSNCQTLP